MFCPKCGTQNPDDGRFCRSCGADLGNVSAALSGRPVAPVELKSRKGKPISWESALTKFFMGIAFLAVSIALAFNSAGRGWWFWLLIPAFSMIGTGIAQYIQIKRAESDRVLPQASVQAANPVIASREPESLPSPSTDFVSPPQTSIYDTGELAPVPPSVTEPTTRHLEMDREGETMTLPKRD